MILEQIDLVDIEKAAMRARQQTGLERLDAGRQRALEIERADDAVLGRTQRQIDEGDRDLRPGRAWSAILIPPLARGDRRQKRGERAHRRRLARPPIAEHHHPADPRIDRGDQQRLLHLVLADDRGKRKGMRMANV